MRNVLFTISAVAALSGPLAWAAPEGPDDTIRIGLSAEPSSADPHFHNFTPNNMLSAHIFESLTTMGRDFTVQPGLAQSFRNLDVNTWEFKLRKNVKFHDGKPLTANDVVFSLCRIPQVPNSPGPMTTYTKSIQSIETPDPYTVVIRTKLPDPTLDREMAVVRIISDGAIKGEKVTYNDAGCKISSPWPTTADFNRGKLAVGTGPFKLVEFVKGDHILLKRNDDYWGAKPVWSNVRMRPIPNAASRVAALLSGDVDLIENPPTQDIPRIRSMGKYRVFSELSVRAIYLTMDESSTAAPAGVSGTNGRNPFKDERVRKALSLAIDREGIANRIMGTFAKPAAQMMDESFYGAAPGVAPLAFEPEKAKQLLAEAGYPNGFELTLATPNDRYVNDAQVAQAVAQMFTRIGVRTNVDAMTSSVFFSKAGRHEFGMLLSGFAPTSGEMGTMLRAVVATPDKAKGWGATNHGQISDVEVDKALGQALVEMDDHRRRTLLGEASMRTTQKMLVIPLYYEKTAWATKAEIVYRGRPDQFTLAQEIQRASK